MDGPRAVRAEEFDSLIELVNMVFMSSRGRAPAMPELYPLLYHPRHAEHMRVMVDGGRVVTHIGVRVWDIVVHGRPVRIGSIGGVATDEAYRGRGLATAVLNDVFAHLRDAGACVAYISGARGLYLRNQAVRASRLFSATATAEASGDGAGRGYQVREFAEDDLDAVIRVHQREPLRYVRPRDEWAMVATVGSRQPGAFWKQRLFGLWSNDGLAAYVAVRVMRDPNATPVVREYGGSRVAIVEAMPAVVQACGADALGLSAQCDDAELVRLLSGRGIPCAPATHGGTWRVLDFGRLMDSLKPWVQERSQETDGPELEWESAGDHGAFVLAGERFEMPDAKTACEVVFGGAGGLDPRVDSAPGALREALRRVLPVPAPLSGLNAI